MNELTDKEKKIFNALAAFIKERGYTPSQRELATKVGLKSPNTIDYHLKHMEQKGVVRCAKGRYRAIEIIKGFLPDPNLLKVPVMGTVPAGAPSLAVEDTQELIEVDRSFVKGKVFGLKVKGDSMKDAGILEGDIVLVKPQSTAEHGDIVVARFQDETTVKYFHKRKLGYYLVPANERYSPIPAYEAQLAGKVVGVMRKYR